jgi:hypothetical protein
MRILRFSKKTKAWLWTVSIFLICLGLFVSTVIVQSPMSMVELNNQFEKRKIASTQVESLLDENMPKDLVDFSGSELATRIKIRLAQKSEFVVNEEKIFLQLPDVQIKNRNGEVGSICESLPFVQVVLEAEGLSFNGDPVQLIVRTHCITSPLPSENILIQLGFEKLKTKNVIQDESGSYRLNYSMGVAGATWFVRQVQLYSAENKFDLIRLNSFEIQKIKGQDLILVGP